MVIERKQNGSFLAIGVSVVFGVADSYGLLSLY